MTSKRRKTGNPNNNYQSTPKPVKPLSCKRCRARKVKCNYEHPCSGCVRSGVECVQTVNDMRKIRPPLNYVSTLETKIDSIMDFFEEFKNLETPEAKQALLDKTDLTKWDNHNESSATASIHLSHHDDDDRAVYGPTSVYDDTLVKNSKLLKRVEESSIKALNKDQDVLECLKLFFTWQYPDHNMFIFREAFLIDFFNPKSNCLYCSKILILSICSLGSKMSEDDRIYNKSVEYYKEAKNMLLSQLNRPSITSMQSYLLLAFYDICNGFNSSGWMLSGNAIRMGYDLGFQLNPEVWFVKSKEDLSPLDVAIRSRIYWGSYTADHFISLLLGRPSLLKVSDASIAETNDLPDLEWIDEFTYSGLLKRMQKEDHKEDVSYISNPLNNIIKLINISDNMLNDIFTKSDVDDNDEVDLSSRLAKLYEYNSQIRNWKACLPADLQWDRNTLKQSADNPTLTCIRYYYYILLLCLNRPFLGMLKNNHKGAHSLSPMAICSEVIEDLYEAIKQFNHVHGLRRVSIFMVYCSILSISIILLTNTSKELINQMKEKLQFFMNVLHGCSKTWKLAEKSYKLIKIKLQARKDELEEFESSQATQPDTPQLRNTLPSITTPTQLGNSVKTESKSFPSISDIMNPPMNNRVSQANETNQPSWNYRTQPAQPYNNVNLSNPPEPGFNNQNIIETNTELLFGENLDFLGGPPVLMTSDLFNEDWEALFPDYVFNAKNQV